MLLVVSDYILVIYRQPRQLLIPITLACGISGIERVLQVQSFCRGLDSYRTLLSYCMHKHLILDLSIADLRVKHIW